MSLLSSFVRAPAVIVALLMVSLVAGCLGADEPNPQFVASGSGGVLFTGWDYAGATRQVVDARLDVDVDEETNSGTVRVGGRMGNDTMTVELTEFVHDTDDFHSGGIAANFDEHGDSGVGNALLPRMHLLLATWGPGTIMQDGNATVDPYTGDTVWDAHLMVTSTGVRDQGQVQNADGSGLYDPADPGNARIGSDTEAHLVLTSRYTNDSLEPVNDTIESTVEPAGTAEIPFEVPVLGATMNAVLDFGGDPQETGPFTISLVDPNGTTVTAASLNRLVPTAGTTATLEAELAETGTWKIVVSTRTGPADFTTHLNVVFPPKPMYYFFWESVDIEQRVVG